jgi:hypothetical protein
MDRAERFTASEAVHPFVVVIKVAAFPVRIRPAKSALKLLVSVYWNAPVPEL